MDRSQLLTGALHEIPYLFSSPDDLDLPSIEIDSRLLSEWATEDEDDLIFDVYVYPQSGEIVQVHQLSTVPGRVSQLRSLLNSTASVLGGLVEAATPNFIIPQTRRQPTAPGRAFNEVRRRMIGGCLTTHARLGYSPELPIYSVRRDISKFALRLRRSHSHLPYVAVPERGAVSKALHWHVALPHFVEATEIQNAWLRGEVHVTRMPDYEALERLVGYLTKSFFDKDVERDFPHRYKRDKQLRIQRLCYKGLTQADVDMLVENVVGSDFLSLSVRSSSHPWIVATYRWKPEHLGDAFASRTQHL